MVRKTSLLRTVQAGLLVAGTAIGAGMLGIPLLTGSAGIEVALLITLLVWGFMLATGLLMAEAVLWSPPQANIITVTRSLLGNGGSFVSSGLFLFLYCALMVAYLAGGAPLLFSLLGISAPSWVGSMLCLLIFGVIVWCGIRTVAWMNSLLSCIMYAAYLGMLILGFYAAKVPSSPNHLGVGLFALPVLFSAFGYHNIIPSLCDYLNRDRQQIRYALWLGTLIALVVYACWQWLMLSIVSVEELEHAKKLGIPATVLLTHSPYIHLCASLFAFLALATSLMGVGLSLVDCIRDGLPWCKSHRLVAVLIAFGVPFLFVIYDPTLFDQALGIAGGIGEALLNGLLPVLLVWIGRYVLHKKKTSLSWNEKPSLVLLALCALSVFCLEILTLLK